MAERSMSRAGGGPSVGGHSGGLGANQIRWLRTNMKPFDDAWKAVQASDAHAHKIKSKLQSDHSRLDTDLEAGGSAVQRLRLVERRTRRRGPVIA